MKSFFKAIFKLITYYSTKPEEFQTYPRYDRRIKETADKFSKADFKKQGPTKYLYKSLVTNTKFLLTINNSKCHNTCSCSCKDFIKVGVRCHLVGLSLTHDLNLNPNQSQKKLCLKKEDENLNQKSLLLKLVKRRLKLPVYQLENN